ncbi:LmbU family transcriptional regulator [Kitasatospora sp. NPDC054939]
MQHFAKDEQQRLLPTPRPGRPSVVPRRTPPAGQPRILTTRLGLRMPSALTFDRWEQAGLQIFRVADSSAWCLGDWLVYGQDRYADRYQAGVEAAGLDYQTLRNYAWVARRFELRRRREQLSFGHHAEVAALPPDDADGWLTRAEQQGWSRNQLRTRVRESRQGTRRPTAADSASLPRICAAVDRVERWREAAERSDRAFEEWVLTVLDSAAARTLDTGPAPSRR